MGVLTPSGKQVVVSAGIDPADYEKLLKICNATDRSEAYVVRKAISRFLTPKKR